MSAYRDRPIDCPRCKRGLVREETRDVWVCKPCRGALVNVGVLIEELLTVAPTLWPDGGGVRSITTIRRRTTGPLLTCPTCGAPMKPVFLGGVELDRCYQDEQIWFDRGEPDLVMERARKQEEPELGVFASLMRRFSGAS